MKRTILYTFSLLILVACGESGSPSSSNSEEPITIEPKTTAIKGALGNHFEVVQKPYKIVASGSDYLRTYLLTVEVKRLNGELPYEPAKTNPFGIEGAEQWHAGFGKYLLNETGTPVTLKPATAGGTGGAYSHEDIQGAPNLKPEETAYIRWSIDDPANLAQFQLTSALEEEQVNIAPNAGNAYQNGIDQYNEALRESREQFNEAVEDGRRQMNEAMEESRQQYREALEDAR